jgi:antitoxin component of RelBE/YafQ-DinJ toxin-antitoxin module
MQSGLVRFMVDPEMRARAEQVCVRNGVDLNEVLRALVIRIARDGQIPSVAAETAPIQTGAAATPFSSFDSRAWSTVVPAVQAELALELIDRLVALGTRELYPIAGSSSGGGASLSIAMEQLRQANAAREALGSDDQDRINVLLEALAQNLVSPREQAQ